MEKITVDNLCKTQRVTKDIVDRITPFHTLSAIAKKQTERLKRIHNPVPWSELDDCQKEFVFRNWIII